MGSSERTGARTFTLTTVPTGLVFMDLMAAAVWMVATAPAPKSVAFALVIIGAAPVQFRLGRMWIAVRAAVLALAVAGPQPGRRSPLRWSAGGRAVWAGAGVGPGGRGVAGCAAGRLSPQ